MRQKLMYHRSLALIAWMGTLLMLPIQVVDLSIFTPRVSAQQPTPQLSEEQLKRLAKSITVKVRSGESGGSGILLRKDSQIYTVITNQHVLESGKPTQIQTEDGKTYPANLVKSVNFQGKDLALLQFRANVNYALAPLGNLATVAVNEPIYAAGFPFEAKGFVFKTGQVLLVSERAFKEGYQIGYSNEIEKGMSGGPILNGRGQVIGINGIHAYPLWGNPYVYEDGSRPTEALLDLMSRYSWGIPIQTLARLAPQYTSKESLPAAKTPSTASLPPIANEVNNIAQEITVLIDVPTMPKCSGSGVIVAKQGNTYSVLTAEHVIRGSQKCDRTVLEVVTHDGKRYSLTVNDSNVKPLPESDLAVLQFTSDQNYRVATLANYDISGEKGFIFVSGWQGSRTTSGESRHQFTAGTVASKQLGSFYAKDSFSLTYGYGLIYTNLTEQGMSGGPVLDIRGRVIGIHGRSEVEEITDKAGQPRLITLGFSWGVPISNFLLWAQQVGIASMLRVDTSTPPLLTPQESGAILESLLKAEKPKDNADAIDWLNYGWQVARNIPDKPLGENETKEAIRAIDQAIQLRPNFYQAWYLRGFVQGSRKEYEEAVKSFEKSAQIQPKFALAWRFRGVMLIFLKRFPESLQSFDQLAKLDPNDLSLQILQSIALSGAERFPESLEVSNQALKKNPGSLAYFARGVARIGTGDFKGALADLNESIRLNPGDTQGSAYSVRGSLRFQQGDLKGALADYNEAVRLDPQDVDFLKKRAEVRFQQQDYKGAIADYNEAIRLDPKDAEAIGSRGVVRLLQQDYKGAIADLNEAIRLKPENPDAITVRAAAIRLLENKPGDVETIKARGAIRLLQQDYKGAIADFSEAIRLKPQDADAIKVRAAAISLLENKPAGDVETIKARGAIRLLQKDYKGAIADYNEAIRLKPEDADAYYKRGQIHAQIKDNQGARQDLQKAADLYKQQSKADEYQKVIAEIKELPQ